MRKFWDENCIELLCFGPNVLMFGYLIGYLIWRLVTQ